MRVKFKPTASSLSAASALMYASSFTGTAAVAASWPRHISSFAQHPCRPAIVVPGAAVAAAVAPAKQPRRRRQRWQQQQQVRFHRTDYDGPGRYDERETGANFGATAAHDHSHAHDDRHPPHEEEDEELPRMRELLRARYDRRSGTYEHRGYTVGIGGPGESLFCFCKFHLFFSTCAKSHPRNATHRHRLESPRGGRIFRG